MELLEKNKNSDENVLKVVLSLLMQVCAVRCPAKSDVYLAISHDWLSDVM